MISRTLFTTARFAKLKPSLSVVVVLILITGSFSWSPRLAFAGAKTQVWGRLNLCCGNTGFWGIDSYLTTPDPNLLILQWTAAPNAVTTLYGPQFIESGPSKNYKRDQGRQPYGTCQDATGYYQENFATDVNLGAGQLYHYKSYLLAGGNHQWQSVYCDGVGCRGMITCNLGVDSLPYLVSGGESSGSDSHWGSVQTRSASYLTSGSGTYYLWCYSTTDVINAPGGSVGSCSNAQWTSNY